MKKRIKNDKSSEEIIASLVKAYEIFIKAYSAVSGLARTVRGPSMSATPGKVHVLGMANLNDQKVIILSFLQGRNSDWVQTPFFAKYDENAIWLEVRRIK